MNELQKKCKICQIDKSLDMFRISKNYYRSECRKCENQKRIENRKNKLLYETEYKNKIREYDKERKRLSRSSKKTNV